MAAKFKKALVKVTFYPFCVAGKNQRRSSASGFFSAMTKLSQVCEERQLEQSWGPFKEKKLRHANFEKMQSHFQALLLIFMVLVLRGKLWAFTSLCKENNKNSICLFRSVVVYRKRNLLELSQPQFLARIFHASNNQISWIWRLFLPGWGLDQPNYTGSRASVCQCYGHQSYPDTKSC